MLKILPSLLSVVVAKLRYSKQWSLYWRRVSYSKLFNAFLPSGGQKYEEAHECTTWNELLHYVCLCTAELIHCIWYHVTILCDIDKVVWTCILGGGKKSLSYLIIRTQCSSGSQWTWDCSEEPSLDTGSVWKAMGAKLKTMYHLMDICFIENLSYIPSTHNK